MTKWSQATMAIPPRKSLLGKIDYGVYTGNMNLIAKAAESGSAPILQEFQVNGWSEIDTMLRERTVQLWSMDAQQWADGVFLLPTASLLTLFVLYPLLRSGLLSLQNWHIFSGEATWMGARNYTYSHLMAMSVVSLLPIAVVFALFQRQLIQGIAHSGVNN
jgi:hypothetical protein